MTVREALLGATLQAWLDRLDAEGFNLGVRERLVVHELLARLAAGGELPAGEKDALALLAPLLCTSPESQRRYAQLLAGFTVPQTGQREGAAPAEAAAEAAAAAMLKPRRTRLPVLGLLLVIAAALAVWWFGRLGPAAEPGPGPAASAPAPTSAASQPTPDAPGIPHPIYVPVRPLPLQPAPVPPAWTEPLRWGLAALGALCALALAGMAWARRRRTLFLHGTRSDEEVQERVLSDPHAGAVPLPAPLLRTASRDLRRRTAGEREVLDLPSTLRATVRAGGAFSPCWRLLHHTPEYLALIDRRHPQDHQAAVAEALLHALRKLGVAVQAWYFEGSPEHGCWQLRPGPHGPEAFGRSGLAELAARLGGQRLLVLAEASALTDPLGGGARPWARALAAFPQRAWFTPRPMASWGTPEAVADAQGFLVLPLQPEAFGTLANWLSSGDLLLEAGADWPLAWPPLLAQEASAWVARQTAPPLQVLEDLLFQLRVYLGARRFQWLCGCAVFPALSPPLTLALGRVLDEDSRHLALGLTALGALPWFRHGHMPAWLRQALLERLDEACERRFRAAIEERLAGALVGGQNVLVTLALRRRLNAWLTRGRGAARDVVMVEFLHRSRVTRLAQRLPEGLRRRLFHSASPVHGLRLGVVLGLVPGVVLLGAAVPGVWAVVGPGQGLGPALAAVGAPLEGHGDGVMSVAFSPDGRRIVSGSGDKTVRQWDAGSGQPIGAPLRGHDDLVWSVAFSPDGRRIVSGSEDGTVRLWYARSGQLIGAALEGHEAAVRSVAFSPDGRRIASGSEDETLWLWDTNSGQPIGAPLAGHWARVLSVAFSPNGRRIVSGSSDKTLRLWDTGSGQPIGVPLEGHTGAVRSVAFSPDGRRIVSGSADETVRLWDAGSGQPSSAALAGHRDVLSSVAFSPDGRRIVSGSGDKTLRLWDAGSGQLINAPLEGHKDTVTSVAFSPDGRRIVSGSSDKTLRLWGAPPSPRIDLLSCDGASVDADTRRLADALAQLPPSDPKAWGDADGFDVAAYTPAAWTALHTQQPPSNGEVRHASGNAQQQRLAQGLQGWLTAYRSRTGASTLGQWVVREAAPGLESVVANVCGRVEPLPAVVPAATTAPAPVPQKRPPAPRPRPQPQSSQREAPMPPQQPPAQPASPQQRQPDEAIQKQPPPQQQQSYPPPATVPSEPDAGAEPYEPRGKMAK